METTIIALIEGGEFVWAQQSLVLFVPAIDQSANTYWLARQHIHTSKPAIGVCCCSTSC